jgi:formate hydrogenlyase subunit 3/multisubunit Na+/H+ antiporter MnhD subunit
MIDLINILLSTIAIILISAGLLSPTIDYTFRKKLSGHITLFSLFLTLGMSIILLYLTSTSVPIMIYENSLKIDFFGSFLVMIAISGTILVMFASMPEVKKWTTAPSFYSLLSLTLLGVYYMIFMNDIILLLISSL